MRERRLTVAAVVLLLLAASWGHQPATVAVATDAGAMALPTTAQAELDLGALGVVVLSWTAKRLTAR